MTNKMTNRKALTWVLDNCEVPIEVREKLDGMIASLDRKSANPNRKPTAKQIENAALREKIVALLTEAESPMTCTEIQHAIPELAEFGSQKVSALVKPLVEGKTVTKEVVKGKALFSI